MFTRTRLEALKAIVDAGRPVGVRKIAEATGLAQGEVWRQMDFLVKLKVVKPVLRGRKRFYLPNPESPFFRPMLALRELLDSYGRFIGKGFFEAVEELGYISGPFAMKPYVQEFWTPRTVLLGVEEESMEVASRLAEWFKEEYTVIPFIKRGARTVEDPVLKLRVATYEQAMADMLALFETDPYNNAIALSSIFYTPFDMDELLRASEEWGDKAMKRLASLVSIGRAFGLPIPAVKAREPAEGEFVRMVISTSLRLLRGPARGW